jgi:hypothetical protein
MWTNASGLACVYIWRRLGSADAKHASPTFDRDIAPIVFQNCSPCHQPAQAGPFSLLMYSDVKRHARQILKVTQSRYMPPWLPEENLNWQSVYRYSQPVHLPKETVVSMRFSYDNSSENPRNPNHPPKRVEAGNRASDEMAHLWLQVFAVRSRRSPASAAGSSLATPAGEGSRRSAGPRKSRGLDDVTIADTGRDPRTQTHATILRSRWREPESSMKRFRIFAKCSLPSPNSSRLQNEFGELLTRKGELPQALEQFDKALQLDPGNQYAEKNRKWVKQRMVAPGR